MLFKPFRPPLLRKIPDQPLATPPSSESEPPSKKRRISDDEHFQFLGTEFQQEPHSPKNREFSKKPSIKSDGSTALLPIKNATATNYRPEVQSGAESYYNVLWRKPTAKKHKTWDGDGILSVLDGFAKLQNIDGREMGRIMFDKPLLPESTLSIGGKDVEIQSTMSREEYLAGRPFLKPLREQATLAVPKTTRPSAAKVIPVYTPNVKSVPGTEKDDARQVPRVSTPKVPSVRPAFKNPLKESTVMLQPKSSIEPVPRHDPNQVGALVMKRPINVPRGKQVVDVVVDPLLSKRLREHQREGVKFLYECVMGLRDFNGEGAILADEMGLGKTLQTIALLWTLLKQNPIQGAAPIISKALIVCPVTLIKNWQKEFRKWLGNERIGVFVADGQKHTRLTDFTMGKSYSVMIIGYERLRTVQDELQKGAGVDIVIADEGHRLKTVKNKSALAIQSLNTDRRVILSGTPIQNDLSEFFCMVDFVNPGLLGPFKQFKRNFEDPIVKSRQPNALSKDIERGEARSEELAIETSRFILRRTADILSDYLPPKTEYVLFCDPTPSQASVYRQVLQSPLFQTAIGNPEASLQLITVLKKLCNSPSLLNSKNSEEPVSPTITSLLSTIPPRALHSGSSGKLRVLDQLLHNLRTTTPEKIVLVSNYTSTLDLLANLLSSLSLPFLRLDGSTPSAKRQGLVDDFNRTSSTSCFAFLLSAKAGGVGLNLVGASRLVLFDVDWNPSTDLQAMARIHRDGQKRHCRIYRVVMKGMLEEKIWQRQVTKLGLADSVMEKKMSTAQFSREELRDLFRLDERKGCATHDLLKCSCEGRGSLSDDDFDTPPTVEIPDTDDEEDELPSSSSIIKASSVNVDELEQSIRNGTHPLQQDSRAKETNNMQSLLRYQHIDTSNFAGADWGLQEEVDMDELIDDDILISLLKEEGSGVSWVFKKRAKGGKINDEGIKL